jgi:hypothetical protein
MRKTALTGAAILALSLMLSACSAAGTDSTTTEPAAPEASQSETEAVTRTGDFEGSGDKSVAGSVTVSDSEIVLSGYSSDEGPDLHVYLTNGAEEADIAAGMQIETVAFDEASQTFTLDGVNVADYDTVVIYCDKVKAVFGSASLS